MIGFRLLKLTRLLLKGMINYAGFVHLTLPKVECLFLIDENDFAELNIPDFLIPTSPVKIFVDNS
jgi:hypothetical protein